MVKQAHLSRSVSRTCHLQQRYPNREYPCHIKRDLEEAEDQFQTAMRSHLVNIDVLIKLHDSRLYALERNFQNELLTLQTDFHEEKYEMTVRFRLERKELGAIIETIEKEEQDRESDVRSAYVTMPTILLP